MTGKLNESKLRSAGFTLLELMIVISIIIILASITLPQYQKTVMHTRETVLKDDLRKMRSLIDQGAHLAKIVAQHCLARRHDRLLILR